MREIKSIMKRTWYVARGRDEKCIISVGTPEGKSPLRKGRCGRKGNIKTDLREIGCEGINWIHLAQNRDQWRAVMDTAVNLLVPQFTYSMVQNII
jgi:hypothetical protein